MALQSRSHRAARASSLRSSPSSSQSRWLFMEDFRFPHALAARYQKPSRWVTLSAAGHPSAMRRHLELLPDRFSGLFLIGGSFPGGHSGDHTLTALRDLSVFFAAGILVAEVTLTAGTEILVRSGNCGNWILITTKLSLEFKTWSRIRRYEGHYHSQL